MKKIKKQNKMSAFIVMICFLLVSGCSKEESSRGDIALKKLSVGINTTIKSTPVIIAQQLGFFAKNGLTAELVVYQSGVGATNDLFANKVDIATGPELIPALSRFRRSDFQILAVMDRCITSNLIARKDHGINAIIDLRDKKIGLKKNSGSLYWLNRLLVHNSISLNEVQIIDADPKELLQKLIEGSVDAIDTWQPHAYEAQKALGPNAFSIETQMGQDMYWLILGMKKWIKDNPDLIIRFLKAIDQSIDFINTNPEKAKNIIAKYLSQEKEFVDYEWPMHRFSLELPQSLIIAMEQETRWKLRMAEDGREIPNYLEFIYFDGLSRVKPKTVSIVH